MSTSPNSRVHLVIRGRVQGVGFRYSTIEQARRLGVTGWVRNTDDGDVEVVAEGSKIAIEQLVSWCRHGPRGALVTGVEVRDQPFAGEFRAFDVRH